jgi:hypothetical protein
MTKGNIMVVKGSFKSIVVVILFFATLLSASTIEKRAFKAFKAHNYKQALYLYKQAAKEKSLKSYLMIGYFLEKGLGVKSSKDKAIKIYNIIVKKVQKSRADKNRVKDIDIAIIALKKLYALTNDDSYNGIRAKLEERKNNIMQKDNGTINLYIDDYFAMCPAAKVVDIKYAEGINSIDCELFKNFPDRMARFMKLKSQRAKAIAAKDRGELFSIDKKINRTIKPVLKYIEQQTIECYNSSNYFYDVRACDYNYLTQTDPLLFENRAYKMEQVIAKQDRKDYKIDPYEKEKLINALIYQFSTQDYEKKSYRMVKL